MAVPQWVGFDPDTREMRDDLEDALEHTMTSGLAYAGAEAARLVESALKRKRPEAIVRVKPGPTWTVIDRGARRR